METIEEENHHMCLLAYPFLLLCLVQRCLLPHTVQCGPACCPHTVWSSAAGKSANKDDVFCSHFMFLSQTHTHPHTPTHTHTHTHTPAHATVDPPKSSPEHLWSVELPRLAAFIDFFKGERIVLEQGACGVGIHRCPGFLLNILRATTSPSKEKKISLQCFLMMLPY